MTSRKLPSAGLRRKILFEVILISVLVVCAIVLEGWFGPVQQLMVWIQQHQPWETQDIFFPLTMLAAGLAVFAVRRWKDGRDELTRRREAEEALQQSEEKHRTLLEHIPDITWTVNAELKTIYVSPNAERIWGYTPEEVCGEGSEVWKKSVHPEDMPRLREAWAAFFERGGPYEMEYRLRRKDGRYVWVHARATRCYEVDGARYADGITTDITRRKLVELALMESEENFRELAENASDGLAIVNERGDYLYVNRQVAQMSGYTVEELTRMNFRQLVHPDEHEKLADRLARRLRGEEVPKQYETVGVHKDGSSRVLELTSSRTTWRGVLVDLVTVRDITERKRTERALRESEGRIRTIFDAAEDAIFVKDGGFRYTEVNRAWLQRMKMAREEVIGKRAGDIFAPDVAEMVRRVDERVLAGETVKEDRRFEHGGKVYEVSVIQVPVRDAEGRVVALFGVSRDVTERKRAELALKESEENFRALAENATDGILILDREGYYLYANRLAAEMTCYSVEELLSMNFRDRTPPEEHAKLADRIVRTLRGEPIPRQVESVLSRKGGGWMDIEVSSALTMWKGASADLVVIRDITERKQAEAALREREARYRAVVEDQRELICRYTPELEILFVNEAYCRYFGKSREELIGKTFMPLIPREDHRRVEEFFESLGPHNPVATHEHRVITPSGELRWQEWTNHLLLSAEGEVVEIQAVGRDITERKWAEEALRQSEKHIRDIFEAATTVSFIRTDVEGLDTVITEFSKGAETIFGYTREEVIGEPLGILYKEESLAGFPAVLEKLQQTKTPSTRRVTLVRKNGEEFRALSTCCPIFDGRGELTGTMGVTIELGEDE